MRCAQPFIPIASGRLGKRILELRCFGVADFSKHIADKYSDAELGKFKFPTLTLLERVSSFWNVFNTTQIFKNQVISAPPSTTQLSWNLNILIFLNTVVQKLVQEKSKPQNSHSTRFTFSNNSTLSITRTSLSQLYQRVQIGLTQKKPYQQSTNVFNNILMQFVASKESKSQISQSGGWTFSQSRTILITKTSLLQFNQLENMEVRQKQQTNQAVLSFQNKSNAFALGVGSAIAVESPGLFGLQQSENNTLPTRNLQLEKPASLPQIFVSRSQSPTLLTENKKPVLIHLPNMNQIASTVEGTSQFVQRLQSIETQTILQYRKVATNFTLFYNALTPSITRGKIPASLISQPENSAYQTQQNTNVFNNILMQFVASKESKSQISQSGGWTFSQSRTILISKTSLLQFNQLENIEGRQKQQTSQAVLSFQNKSNAFAFGVGGGIAVESPGLFGLQQSENNTLPTQNLQLEKPASLPQIFVLRSQSSTLLTENQKPVLIHLPNMNQIASTVEGTSQFVHRLQSIENQTILQYRKVATNSNLFYNALNPSITRGKIPASLISQSENSAYQTQQNTNVFNNMLMQKIASKEQISQAVLLFQKKSNAFALGVGGAIAVKSPGSFGLQQSGNNTLPTQNLQLEKPASLPQIFVSRSQSPTLLTENKKPVLIHLPNMNQMASTVEGTSGLIQRLQSIETQTILQYKKVATNSINSQDDLTLAPYHIRTRRLSKYLQNSENLLYQSVDNTNRSQLKQNSFPNILTLEFVQPKANVSSVKNNQENKLENHQDNKGKVKNDLIKQVQPDIPTINVNRIAEQVYQLIEKKIKIERQRRGML